ncbi:MULTISPECIES: hypothetical protein [Bifidobacterium]|uniref:DUF4192 domain-containing protein n=2 Tax=Bifidobacterium TaxID=1678 RepID=A0A087DMX4_9BIFI|nr:MULTISPECIES: hypothetical protein [Bifidobacterium]KFI96874.1 hypothetical protein BSTEL_1783 [Bifidobacterium stellenboschense]NEG89119.1 hypothetical protein [Bifidobacterium aerophilum]
MTVITIEKSDITETAKGAPTQEKLDEEMQMLGERLTAEGRAEALAKYLRPAFTDWLAALREQRAGIVTKHDTIRLATAIRMQLAVRDALIATVIDDTLNVDDMLAYATDPRSERAREGMTALLTRAFKDPDARIDNARLECALKTLDTMAGWPRMYAVQPHAAIAYLAWLAGRDTAEPVRHAMTALLIDQDCTLAAIVMSVVSRGITPACVNES